MASISLYTSRCDVSLKPPFPCHVAWTGPSDSVSSILVAKFTFHQQFLWDTVHGMDVVRDFLTELLLKKACKSQKRCCDQKTNKVLVKLQIFRYISTEFVYYVISPVFLLTLHKSKVFGVALSIFTIVLSSIFRAYAMIAYNLPPTQLGWNTPPIFNSNFMQVWPTTNKVQ